MEKKSVNLLDLFNVDADKYSDLKELKVLKVDIYKAKASINIVLGGVDTLKNGKSLVALVDELEHDFGTKVNFTFNDIDDVNLPVVYDQIAGLIKYYVRRDNSGGIKDVSEFIYLRADTDYDSGDVPGYITYIEVSSGWSRMLSEAERDGLKKAVSDASSILTGDGIRGKFEILNSEPDIPGTDTSLEDDVLRAIEDGRFEVYQEEPAAEQPKKGTKKKKDEKSSDPEVKAGKDSWAFKAEQVRKEAKQEDKQSFYKAKENAENQLYGRVKKQATFMKIADLTVGCFDVNIAGDISFNDDSFKLAKTGKSVIVKFICLDDTDGIACIAFLKPDEADSFQKEFGKGGFIGIQGNVENDSFTGDKTLRVSGLQCGKAAEEEG